MKKTKAKTKWIVMAGFVALLGVATNTSASELWVALANWEGVPASYLTCNESWPIYAEANMYDSDGDLVCTITDYYAGGGGDFWLKNTNCSTGASAEIRLRTWAQVLTEEETPIPYGYVGTGTVRSVHFNGEGNCTSHQILGLAWGMN